MQGRADLEQVDRIPVKHAEHTSSAWLTVAGSFLVYFVSFGYINSFGFFQDYYSRHDLADFSPSVISFIGSLQLGLMYLIGPIVGVLFDAYGIKWLYLVGTLGAVASCIGVSFAQPGHIWQYFLSQGVLYGITVPFGIFVALAVVGQHFQQNRALAMGIVAAGSSVGGVCFPIMLSHIMPRIGFGWTLRIVALIMLVCYCIAGAISVAKLPRKPLKSPREILDFGGFRDIRYSTLALANVIGNFGLYVPYYYIEPYVVARFSSTSLNDYFLPMINGSSFVGRIIGGLLADRVGGLNLIYPVTILCGCLCLLMWLLANQIGIVIGFTCLYGFCSGIFISVMSPVVAHISPDDKIGARLGTFTIWSAIGAFTGTPIGGAFIKHETVEEYRHLIIYTGACLAGAGVLLFVARLLCSRNLRDKW